MSSLLWVHERIVSSAPVPSPVSSYSQDELDPFWNKTPNILQILGREIRFQGRPHASQLTRHLRAEVSSRQSASRHNARPSTHIDERAVEAASERKSEEHGDSGSGGAGDTPVLSLDFGCCALMLDLSLTQRRPS